MEAVPCNTALQPRERVLLKQGGGGAAQGRGRSVDCDAPSAHSREATEGELRAFWRGYYSQIKRPPLLETVKRALEHPEVVQALDNLKNAFPLDLINIENPTTRHTRGITVHILAFEEHFNNWLQVAAAKQDANAEALFVRAVRRSIPPVDDRSELLWKFLQHSTFVDLPENPFAPMPERAPHEHRAPHGKNAASVIAVRTKNCLDFSSVMIETKTTIVKILRAREGTPDAALSSFAAVSSLLSPTKKQHIDDFLKKSGAIINLFYKDVADPLNAYHASMKKDDR